jgi:hypothetical protein
MALISDSLTQNILLLQRPNSLTCCFNHIYLKAERTIEVLPGFRQVVSYNCSFVLQEVIV